MKTRALLGALPAVASAACISSGDHSTINNALRSGGAGAVVQLCENALIKIVDQISFTADDQEILTQNSPTGSTRATIQVAPGSSTNTLIAGRFHRIKIKNIQLDGNRGGAGFEQATIVNNDIGPCGQSGYNDQVIFGSPGTTVNNNATISSSDYLGFGAINTVDGQYHGSYAGVKVTNNKIQEITGNSISGHVVFPIAVNGWTGGLTVSGNDASGVTKPKSSFSHASHCVDPIQQVLNQNANFVYFPAGVTGSKNLQSDFVASNGNMTNFLCTSLPLSDSKVFQKGQLDIVSDSGHFTDLHGVIAQYQGDNNVVVLQAGKPVWAIGHTLGPGCSKPSGCRMRFGADGNLGTCYNNALQWSSNTGGRGSTMVVLNKAPWIQIKDGSGNVIWDTTKSN
ncbi:hypothetical protein PWT90_07918 [Aphanocladium album]|nr:hypothetical protein PWT90_07918 [Aphanocladium album]